MRQAQYSNHVQQHPLTVTSWHDHQHTELAGTTAEHPSSAASSGRRGRHPEARRLGVRTACDSERPTAVTHGQSWSLGGCKHESAQSAFALVRALETRPK